LRQELQQLKALLDGGLLDRVGVFSLGGELQFFLSNEEIEAEMARIEREMKRRKLMTPFGQRPSQAGKQGEADAVEYVEAVDRTLRARAERLTRSVETEAEKNMRIWQEVMSVSDLLDPETIRRWQDEILQPI